jgi:hypothetical protein
MHRIALAHSPIGAWHATRFAFEKQEGAVMNRTPWVAMGERCVLWVVLAAGGALGCDPPVVAPRPDAAVIDPPDSSPPDGFIDDRRDTPLACGSSGSSGAPCRSGECGPDLTCTMERAATTIAAVFGVAQGAAGDLEHPDYDVARAVPVPADDVPFNAWRGSICAEECDLGATTDGCGGCATCSGALTQNAFVNAIGGAGLTFGAAATFENSGLCRLSCTFEPSVRGGECAGETTCDAFSETCVEECTSDAECRMGLGITFDGEIVTVVDGTSASACNTVTGRCEVPGSAAAHVGDVCDSGNDCAPGTGVCLRGGLCASVGCGTAGTTCDGANGLCLNVNENQTLCLAGCNTVADCAPGNACEPLGGTIGTFTGFCIGACADDSDCAASETCTDTIDAAGAPRDGGCVPRCTAVGAIGAASGGCAADEFCVADHTGAAYGFCRAVDQLCGANNAIDLAAASAECATGWVCDELLASGGGPGFGNRDVVGDGHCTPACAIDADCTAAGTTCVTSGAYAGLCRQSCDAATACPMGQTCDTGEARCVEAPPPV